MFFLVYWLPPLTVAGIIFKLSSGTVPTTSDVFWQDFAVKKLAHVLVYGIFTILIYRALTASKVAKKKAIVWAIILAVIYGITDEYHQYFTQGRESRVRDVFFDAGGSALAMYFTIKVLPKLPSDVREIGRRLEII